VRLSPVTGGPPWIAGVFVYHGRVVPVVDLHTLVGAGQCPLHLSSRVILLRWPLTVPESLVGLLATQVAEIRPVPSGPEQPLPVHPDRLGLGAARPDGEGILRILDPDWLLRQLAAGSGGLIAAGVGE
jgi:chemotaxis-related protein WspB